MLDIEEIEKKYNFENLVYKDIKIWGYLRGVYGPYSLFKHRGIKEKTIFLKIKDKFNYFIDAFTGIYNYFKDYEYIIFSNLDSLKLVNHEYHDRMAHSTMEYFGFEKCLYIATNNKKLPKYKQRIKYNYASSYFLLLLSKFFYTFHIKNKIKLEALDIVNKEFKIKIDYSNHIYKFLSLYYIHKVFFKIKSPKVVFVTGFSARAIVKAANDLGIPTVEFQHGVISDNYVYNSPIKDDYSFQAKYLLVYGNNDKKLFNSYNYIQDKNNIFAIGNYYIDSIQSSTINLPIDRDYKYKVIVSLQSPIAKDMLNFIFSVAEELKDILFILVPRVESDLKIFEEKENVKYYPDFNCYELANNCDIHISDQP